MKTKQAEAQLLDRNAIRSEIRKLKRELKVIFNVSHGGASMNAKKICPK